MAKNISRRALLKNGFMGLVATGGAAALTACGGGGGDGAASSENLNATGFFNSVINSAADDGSQTDSIQAQFTHGVASGDPLQDSVILWARLEPLAGQDKNTPLQATWEVASDSLFQNIVSQGTVKTALAQDFTIKVEAKDLSPNTQYFYRFRYGNNTVSDIGKTKTLPTGDVQQVKFAVCSCSNYPAGYFTVYREMAKSDADVVIHLGDYIYEYPMDDYGTNEYTQKHNRTPQPKYRLNSIDDYRTRYKQYRSDPDLQRLHREKPFIMVWDDHEVVNDAYWNGGDHYEENDARYSRLKCNGLSVYFEWLPIRHDHRLSCSGMSDSNFFNIARQFNFGNLVQLNMMDTRHLARSRALSYSEARTSMLHDPNRVMLGKPQREALFSSLRQSTAKWNVLGQQVLMSRVMVPEELIDTIIRVQKEVTENQNLSLVEQFQKYKEMMANVRELNALRKQYNQGAALSETDKNRVTRLTPFNLDSWDGYPVERDILYREFKNMGKKVIVLAGDSHNGWQSTLKDNDGQVMGVEFATPSVSSPGLEEYLKADKVVNGYRWLDLSLFPDRDVINDRNTLRDAFNTYNEIWCNIHQRGFMLVTFTQQQARSDWIFIDDVITTKDGKVDTNAAYSCIVNSDFSKTEIKAVNA